MTAEKESTPPPSSTHDGDIEMAQDLSPSAAFIGANDLTSESASDIAPVSKKSALSMKKKITKTFESKEKVVEKKTEKEEDVEMSADDAEDTMPCADPKPKGSVPSVSLNKKKVMLKRKRTPQSLTLPSVTPQATKKLHKDVESSNSKPPHSASFHPADVATASLTPTSLPILPFPEFASKVITLFRGDDRTFDLHVIFIYFD
jgi:hypothetical protein